MVDPKKPFTEYTKQDWRDHDKWSAGELRKAALREEQRGRTDLAVKFRSSADMHEKRAKQS